MELNRSNFIDVLIDSLRKEIETQVREEIENPSPPISSFQIPKSDTLTGLYRDTIETYVFKKQDHYKQTQPINKKQTRVLLEPNQNLGSKQNSQTPPSEKTKRQMELTKEQALALDLFEKLGSNLSDHLTSESLKKEYKKLAFRFHPDRNKQKNASETYVQVQEAFKVLLQMFF